MYIVTFVIILILIILQRIVFIKDKMSNDPSVERKLKLINIIKGLNLKKGSKILDIGGQDYYDYFKNSDIEYVMIDIEQPLDHGGGGYHRHEEGMTFNGRDLPFGSNSFDLVIISFVLHHAANNTLPLLKQVKNISSKYVIIGEDLSEIDYELEWHNRNYEHQPGGVFRSDAEWQELFKLYGYKLLQKYPIKRHTDPDINKDYRMLYLLEV